MMAEEEGACFIHVDWKREPALFSDIYWLFKVAWILRNLDLMRLFLQHRRLDLLGHWRPYWRVFP